MANFKAPKVTKENPLEMYARWYFDELVQYGFLKRYDREFEKFNVMQSYNYYREIFHKVKPNEKEVFALAPEINYTYDYRLIWTEKAINIFTEIMYPGGCFRFGIPEFVSHYINIDGVNEIVSYVDVKPHANAVAFGGGKMASYYTFPFIQKILLLTKDLYVNKMIPVNSGKHGVNTCTFARTFVPNRYLYTDGAKDLRTIKFKKTGIQAYYDSKKAVVDGLLKQEELKQIKHNQPKLL